MNWTYWNFLEPTGIDTGRHPLRQSLVQYSPATSTKLFIINTIYVIASPVSSSDFPWNPRYLVGTNEGTHRAADILPRSTYALRCLRVSLDCGQPRRPSSPVTAEGSAR